MSIAMFICDETGGLEPGSCLPVFTERVFVTNVRPIAERLRADLVSSFSLGVEVTISHVEQLEGELKSVLMNIPDCAEKRDYIAPRIERLLAGIREIFDDRPHAVLWIG